MKSTVNTAFIGEVHDDHVVGMIGAGVNKLDRLAAQREGHAVLEGDVGCADASVRAGKILGQIGVTNEGDVVAINLAARGVILMVMAVDHVLDGHVEALGDFILQPGRRGRVDRIGGDDAVGRDEKDADVEAVLEAVEIACDLGDFARALLGIGGGGEKERRKGDGDGAQDHGGLP
jgi:hypothetical protein